MDKLILGVAIAASLLIVPLIATAFIENRRNSSDPMKWLKRHGMLVRVQVAQVQTGQDWKYGQGWYRDPWDGMLKRKRTWQTHYEVTGKPGKGHPVRVIVDSRNPSRYRMDVPPSLSE